MQALSAIAFPWHDLRVDFGSKLLRSIKSAQGMKMVQHALDHEDINLGFLRQRHGGGAL
jgi:hypothetical protein